MKQFPISKTVTQRSPNQHLLVHRDRVALAGAHGGRTQAAVELWGWGGLGSVGAAGCTVVSTQIAYSAP